MHHIWISMYVFFNYKFPCREIGKGYVENSFSYNESSVDSVMDEHITGKTQYSSWGCSLVLLLNSNSSNHNFWRSSALDSQMLCLFAAKAVHLAALWLLVICHWWIVFSHCFPYRQWWKPHGVSWKKSCLKT